MKILPIASNPQAFKGLLSQERKYINTESLYGGEYDCSYYERYYHPFSDETDSEIESNKLKFEQKINAKERENVEHSCSGSYTSVRVGKRLPISSYDYDLMKKGIAPDILFLLKK